MLGEEVHTESCPHRLMECVECELIMAQYGLLDHECPVVDRPMKVKDVDWVDHEDEGICQCERNKWEKKERKGKKVVKVEGGAGGG